MTLALVIFYLWLGVLAFRPAPSVGWTLANADRISGITHGGQAEQAGIRPGDQVINVNHSSRGYRLGLYHGTDVLRFVLTTAR